MNARLQCHVFDLTEGGKYTGVTGGNGGDHAARYQNKSEKRQKLTAAQLPAGAAEAENYKKYKNNE